MGMIDWVCLSLSSKKCR